MADKGRTGHIVNVHLFVRCRNNLLDRGGAGRRGQDKQGKLDN